MADYSFINSGHCLGGVIPDMTLVDVDANADIVIGDIVAVVFKSDGPFARFGRWLTGENLSGVTKIFLGYDEAPGGDDVMLFGQIDPPLIAPILRSGIEAMHLVTGGTPGSEAPPSQMESDRLAMELLGPFFRRCPVQSPINPAWRPEGEENDS